MLPSIPRSPNEIQQLQAEAARQQRVAHLVQVRELAKTLAKQRVQQTRRSAHELAAVRDREQQESWAAQQVARIVDVEDRIDLLAGVIGASCRDAAVATASKAYSTDQLRKRVSRQQADERARSTDAVRAAAAEDKENRAPAVELQRRRERSKQEERARAKHLALQLQNDPTAQLIARLQKAEIKRLSARHLRVQQLARFEAARTHHDYNVIKCESIKPRSNARDEARVETVRTAERHRSKAEKNAEFERIRSQRGEAQKRALELEKDKKSLLDRLENLMKEDRRRKQTMPLSTPYIDRDVTDDFERIVREKY